MASVSKRPHTKADGTNGDKWVVRYIDPATGKRPARSFDRKKDADVFCRKVEREIEDGTHVTDAATMTVAAVTKEYISHNAARVRDGRITAARLDNIQMAVRNHIVPTFGGIAIRDVTMVSVDAFYQRLTTEKALTPIYARQLVKEFNMVEQFAFKRGYTKARPIQAALSDLRGIAPARISTPSTEQAAAILRGVLGHKFKANPRTEARTACMVHLAACCGLRLGEIMALTRDNLDLAGGLVKVRHSITIRNVLKGPKTKAGLRDLPIPAHLRAMLTDWMARFYIENERGIVFTDRNGRNCRHPMIHHNWTRLLETLGMLDPADPLHFHSLRHFAGSWWIANGMSIPDVSRNLGHADPATTMRVYAHSLATGDDRAAAIEGPAALLMTHGDASRALVSAG